MHMRARLILQYHSRFDQDSGIYQNNIKYCNLDLKQDPKNLKTRLLTWLKVELIMLIAQNRTLARLMIPRMKPQAGLFNPRTRAHIVCRKY